MAEYDPIRDYGRPAAGTRKTPEPDSIPADRIDQAQVHRPKDAIPVHVRLIWADGTRKPYTVPGFAYAWTRAHVLASFHWSIEYYTASIERWLPAEQIRRRSLSRDTRPWYEQRYYGGR